MTLHGGPRENPSFTLNDRAGHGAGLNRGMPEPHLDLERRCDGGEKTRELAQKQKEEIPDSAVCEEREESIRGQITY